MEPDRPDVRPFASVALIGLGLMGGSLARALRELPARPEIIGFSPESAERGAALAARVLDRATESADEAAGSAELVIYAVPLSATLALLDRHARMWRSDAAVSDVCSLKSPITARARALGVGSRYVGAHPMTGGEASGFAASRSGLYRDAPVWLTAEGAQATVRARVERFWRALGAHPAWIEPNAHDRQMVRASHLPQVVANVLADTMRSAGLRPADIGPGGRDMTRLAGSSPEMWRDLLETSAPQLAPALKAMSDALAAAAGSLEAGDLDPLVRLMERTRAWKGEGSAADA
jgi:prephenate dehydrogenase